MVSLSAELEQTRLEAQQFAVVHNEKTEEAISFQKRSFQETANLFEASTRDICQAEVAHSNAAIEADAFSVIQKQREELGNATTIVTHLREHLSAASQQSQVESIMEQHLVQQLASEMSEHRAASQQQETVIKLRLEDTAQKSHELILREREEAIKTEAEERHALGIQSFQQQVSHLTS